jgi:uncharacterized protein YjiS (DUF1127 family)
MHFPRQSSSFPHYYTDTIDTIEVHMREYTLWQSQTRHAAGLNGRFSRWLRNRRARSGLAILMKMDDYRLRDIGLTRDDLEALARAPRDLDIQCEIERLRLTNSVVR